MIEKVVVDEVVKRAISNTKQGNIYKEMITYIMNGILNMKGSIQLPVLSKVFEIFPDYKKECIDLYNGIFGLNDYVTEIPDYIKAVQGAVFDGLCIMYDWNQGKDLGIVTLNNRIIDPSEEDMCDTKLLDKVMENNRVGLIHSVRYDFDYNDYGPKTANVKCVKHRTKIDEDNIILIPLISTMAMIEIIKREMSSKRILAVLSVSSVGEKKIRVVSESWEHLTHYCDSISACVGLSAEYYSLGGFVYAPVLGAPSTTAMKTRIDILNLEGVMQIKSYQQCAKLGVQKVKDPVNSLFKEEAILISLAEMKSNNPDRYMQFLNKLPDSHIFKDMMDGDISTRTISNYLHSISEAKVSALLKAIPGATEMYEKRSSIVNGVSNPLEIKSAGDLRSALRSRVLKVVWKKSNGVYASSICTNNNNILRSIYGEDYFGKYESVGVRISNAVSDVIDLGMPLDVACKTYGFSDEIANKVSELAKGEDESYENAFYQVLGKKKRSSSSKENTITARTLSGYICGGSEGELKVVDYYISIDTTNLVRVEEFG